jgi:hypothetical protein
MLIWDINPRSTPNFNSKFQFSSFTTTTDRQQQQTLQMLHQLQQQQQQQTDNIYELQEAGIGRSGQKS